MQSCPTGVALHRFLCGGQMEVEGISAFYTGTLGLVQSATEWWPQTSGWIGKIGDRSQDVYSFWLIWHTCQWAYAIVICPWFIWHTCQWAFAYHDLSVMCCCHHHWCCCHHHHWCHLCTAVPVTALITEMLYLADITIYIPSICTWNIGSMWCIFLKWQPF